MGRLCSKTDVTYRALHSLRHTAGTRLMRQTGNPQTVQKFLGHASISTTSIYMKWSDDGLKAALGEWMV